MDSMLKEIARIQDRYNSAMHSDEAFVNYSDDLINELSAIAKKYPSEFTPLMLLKSIICKSRNQTKHIDILNKMIDMIVKIVMKINTEPALLGFYGNREVDRWASLYQPLRRGKSWGKF